MTTPKMIEGEAISDLPNVFITFMGDNFMPGVKEAATAAAKRIWEMDWTGALGSVGNLCIKPYQGLGAMRNQAIMSALNNNASHILILDNDVLLSDPDTIKKLVERNRLCIVPWFDQSSFTTVDKFRRVSWPAYYPNQGIQRLQWHTTNCLLLDLRVARLAGCRIFTDPLIVSEEAYIFEYLASCGVNLYQDTDVQVTLLRPPSDMRANIIEELSKMPDNARCSIVVK